MKTSQDSPIQEPINETEAADLSIASNDNRKVSREDIELVQNLIERCLQLYMNKSEVVRTLSTRARIEPGFTTLVWQKLEEENAEFFRAYYIRLKLKKQIIMFNHLLEHQYHLMKYPAPPKVPLSPIQNGIHTMPVNNHMPMGYPVLQPPPHQPPPPHIAAGGPHASEMSSCHVVNGIPAPSNYQPIRLNSDNNNNNNNNNMMIDTSNTNGSAPDPLPHHPPAGAMSALSDIPLSPSSAASSNHFPFSSSDLTGLGLDPVTGFGPDTGGLQLGVETGGVGSSRDAIQSLGLWNFSLSDLTADLTSLGDLGALENYTGTPFLPSDSDILLDSPDNDDIVEEYFADTITGPAQSDEEKS